MIKQKKKDLNNLSDFNDWIRETFNWVDFGVKNYLKRAWCARGKYYRKNKLKNKKNTKVFTKKELKMLKNAEKSKIKNSNEISKCCNAPVRIEGMPDFVGSNHIYTMYYVCTKCEKPCDVISLKTK